MKQVNITLGQFLPGNSYIHNLDPRTKIFCSLSLMTLVLFVHTPQLLLFYLCVSVLLFFLARISPALAFRNLRPFLFLFVFTIVLHAVFTAGDPLWRCPALHLAVTGEGLLRGVFYTLRISVLVVMASLLTLTTQPMALTDAVEHLLKPFRKIGVPAHEIAMMLSISLRFIPTLLEEAERIKKAQISRGAEISGSLRQKLRSLVPLLIPLFLSTFRRANELALAMDARCYRGGTGRTNYIRLSFSLNDFIAFAMTLAAAVPVLSGVRS
ncbi:energy-coupling factor transporter transmembrane protein EcfT [bacterium]|nr:energy-coupling factor transporter transmembrane protein EcfT [bacterium]